MLLSSYPSQIICVSWIIREQRRSLKLSQLHLHWERLGTERGNGIHFTEDSVNIDVHKPYCGDYNLHTRFQNGKDSRNMAHSSHLGTHRVCT